MVKENYQKGSLDFTTDIQVLLPNVEIVFIAVGTPMGQDGSADLRYVVNVATIGQKMSTPLIVVNKSTVPVGTADKVKSVINHELSKRNINIPFPVVSNPEFLKGDAINDFMHPDK